jgi:hypothetical protein
VRPSKNSLLLLLAFLLYAATPPLNAQVLSANNAELHRASSAVALLPDAPMPSKARPASAAMPQLRPRTSFDDLKSPLSSFGKFKWAMRETAQETLPGAGIAAGISMASDSSLERGYGMGGKGFGRRYLAVMAQSGTSHIVGDFALASILHQDPRYHPSGRRGFGRRLGWAISRVFVTQTDSGKHQFNISRLFGVAAGAAAANGWHRDVNRGGPETAQRFGWEIVGDAAANIAREFWEYRKYPRQ